MTVGHEDLAVRRDHHVGWAVEGVGACARHAGLAERHQVIKFDPDGKVLLTPGSGPCPSWYVSS
jgi:hypothetical protein